MLIIFFRAIILYTALLIVMRMMGKRQIGEMQPFELIITLLIAELACIPMTDISIPLSYGLVSVLAIFILHQFMSLLERAGDKVKFMLSGRPSIVITPRGVNIKELRINNMGVEDLIESMRSNGYFGLDELDYAIFESNGKLSALKKREIDNPPKAPPYLLISQGKCLKNNFELFGLTFDSFNKLIGNKIFAPKQAEIATIDCNGRVYLQLKEKQYEVINVKLPQKPNPNKKINQYNIIK